MSITIAGCLERARDVLGAAGALQAWCASTYGQGLTIFVGVDERNPPAVGDCPFVALTPIMTACGEGEEEHAQGMGVDVGLCDETRTESGGVVEYAGVTRVVELWALVWDALVAEFSSEVQLSASQVAWVSGDTFPLFMGLADVTVAYDQVLGGERHL